jgi:hypothetical protein
MSSTVTVYVSGCSGENVNDGAGLYVITGGALLLGSGDIVAVYGGTPPNTETLIRPLVSPLHVTKVVTSVLLPS